MKKFLVLLFLFLQFGSWGYASVLPANYSAGQTLPYSDLNQMLTERKGTLKPIDSVTREYINNTYDLGSSSYYWANGYITTINATTVNATGALAINGISINTPKTLSGIAYLATANTFIGSQTITQNSGATLNIVALSNAAGLILNGSNGSYQGGKIQFKIGAVDHSFIIDDGTSLWLSATSGQEVYFSAAALATAGTVYFNGSSGYGFLTTTNPSDINLKKNIQLIPDGQLQKILNLLPKSWDWKADGKPALGFIAQDLEIIYPELVETSNNGKKGIYSDRLVPLLIKAFQEQNEKIKSLESRIEALENK